jgi:hypothetical protein
MGAKAATKISLFEESNSHQKPPIAQINRSALFDLYKMI